MDQTQAFAKLQSIRQEHLLKTWSKLSISEKLSLLEQIDKLNLNLFQQQKDLLSHPPQKKSGTFEPFQDFFSSGSSSDKQLGQKLLEEGKMGCLVVAGGQGTRLQLQGPKGLYPISVIRKKTLFQLFAEKIVAASQLAFRPLHAAIMTSPLNHEMTETYFKAHSFFGLTRGQIDFFSQSMLPFLDDNGNLFLQNVSTIAQGPNGNGSSLFEFSQHGLLEKWKELGIEHLNFVLIDNPLADPFDAELLGFHVRNQNDITIKCTLKADPDEKVGVVVKENDGVRIIEYMEMPEEERLKTSSNGLLKYPCANISLFCIRLSFLEKLCNQRAPLPLHSAYKSAESLEGKIMAWKFEYFIFDILPLAEKVQALLYPREDCFAPLKNLSGNDSPETVRAALQRKDQQIYRELFNKEPPSTPFELAQGFHYPLSHYINKWKHRFLSNDGYLGEE